MERFIIIEVEMFKEYKIAMLSYRSIGTIMYMFLADRYYLGEMTQNNHNTVRVNKFTTYELAERAVKELNDDEIETAEYDKVMLGTDPKEKNMFKDDFEEKEINRPSDYMELGGSI